MKYVIFRTGDFVFFPKSMNHADFTKLGTPVSAGFCSIEQYRNEFGDIRYKVSCWGESVSLKLKSNKEEDELTIMSGLNI